MKWIYLFDLKHKNSLQVDNDFIGFSYQYFFKKTTACEAIANFVEYSACSILMLVFYLATSMCGLSVKAVQCLVYSSDVIYKGLTLSHTTKFWT